LRALAIAGLAAGLLEIGAAAQVQSVPGLVPVPTFSAFATYTSAQPNSGSGTNAQLYGPSVGAFYQTSHVIGFEVRATATRYGGFNHQDLALGGARIVLHHRRFAPYGAFLFGAAHARYPEPPLPSGKIPQFVGIGPAWQMVGGADYNLQHHFRIRVGEFSYSNIYLSTRTLSPWSFGTGLVFRIH
jgi:hypothetical protein